MTSAREMICSYASNIKENNWGKHFILNFEALLAI